MAPMSNKRSMAQQYDEDNGISRDPRRRATRRKVKQALRLLCQHGEDPDKVEEMIDQYDDA